MTVRPTSRVGRHSLSWALLRTRLVVGVLVATIALVWGGMLWVRDALRADMEAAISAQQYSVVSLIARDVDRALRERIDALRVVGAGLVVGSGYVAVPAQTYLESRQTLGILFNWGVILTDAEGRAIASVPAALGRTGVDYGSVPAVRQVLDSGVEAVGDPVLGRQTHQPVMTIVVPLKDAQGRVLGCVMGVTNLNRPNFLDDVSRAKFGSTGDYLITSPRTRAYVASSDPRRLLTVGPPRGVNPVYDRYLDGYEGSGVALSSRGVEELSSSARIPSTGWLMQSVLPTSEAFAPIREIEHRVFAASALVSLLAAVLLGWWLKRQLHPMEEAAGMLTAMREGELPRQPLPVRRDDEIGRLTGAFNDLLAAVIAEEAKAVEHAASERVRKTVSHVPGVVFQYRLLPDGRGSFPFVSEAFADIYGLPPASVAEDSAPMRQMCHPDDRDKLFDSLRAAARNLSLWRCEYRIVMASGEIKWLLVEGMPERAEDGVVICYGFIADISRAKQMEADLRVAATTFEIQEGLVVTDARGMVLRVNPAFTAITGYAAGEVVGRHVSLLNASREGAGFFRAIWRSLRDKDVWQGEIWNRRKNGEIFAEWLTASAVRDESGRLTNYVGAFQDITARKAAEDEIRNLAFYDPLTHLPNRRLLMDRLRHALTASVRSQRHGALIFLDLDNFKTLNDTLGHDVGDLLLVEVARRLETCVRAEDTVARLGGDEFIVMLEDLGTDPGEAAGQAEGVGQKLVAALHRPYTLAGHDYHGTPSLGVALFRGSEFGTDELLKRADLAMYQAKAAGRNTLRFFDPAMQASLNARSRLENELYRAVGGHEFMLYYQPQVDARLGCVGVEALLRWKHPLRGVVGPGSFIPLAEESSLILEIGRWVLAESCRQLQAWQQAPATAGLTMAVNVSARQFRQQGFVAELKALLEQHVLRPRSLKLEITESVLLADVDDAIVKMEALRDLGVLFSLDDFGTGYSSLAYLKRLPIDQVKIDQSFVRDVLTDPNDAAICRAVIALGASLGLDVIAEGVEQPTQWDFLQANGCRLAQGFMFGYPMAEAEFRNWLAARNDRVRESA